MLSVIEIKKLYSAPNFRPRSLETKAQVKKRQLKESIDYEEKILLFCENDFRSTEQLAEHMKCSKGTITHYTKKLIADNRLMSEKRKIVTGGLMRIRSFKFYKTLK